jgi:hypothetical protein
MRNHSLHTEYTPAAQGASLLTCRSRVIGMAIDVEMKLFPIEADGWNHCPGSRSLQVRARF